MRRIAFLLLALVILSMCAGWACAQIGGIADCPNIRVSCPDTDLGPSLTFSATISGADPSAKLSFNWTVSGGRIVRGQGTASITVETPDYGGTFAASVEVGGLPGPCANKASCTTSVIRDPQPRRMDEYGGVRPKDERARLNHLAAELRKEPSAQGCILSYAGRHSWEGEASWRGERARRYLIRSGFDPRRIVVIDAGYRESHAIELYVVPSGAISLPTASPTVDPREARITGRRKRPVPL
jgi:hypothetical protein